jgi:hypothetical protein
MHRMNEWTELCGELGTQANLDNLSRNNFERAYGCANLDLGGRVFIPKDYNGLALNEARLNQLYAVANGTDVTRIGMKNIFRPMLCFSAVITEWPKELKLYSPLAGNNEIALLPTTRVLLR